MFICTNFVEFGGKDRQIPKKKQIKWQLQIQRKFKELQTTKRQQFAKIQ
jgi:hypothetical protein